MNDDVLNPAWPLIFQNPCTWTDGWDGSAWTDPPAEVPAHLRPPMEVLADANAVVAGFDRVRRAAPNKPSTARWELNLLEFTTSLLERLRTGTYKQGPGFNFTLNEGGRLRAINALNVDDMIVQHVVTDGVLVPRLRRLLIHDAGASLKGKGLSFTRRRFEQHVREFVHLHGLDRGHVLKVDFRRFFDNVDHEKLLDLLQRAIRCQAFIDFVAALLKRSEVDISHLPPGVVPEIFNSVEYLRVPRRLRTGRRFLRRSLGVGSPTSQILGLFLLTRVDSLCQTVHRCRFYDAYMDDRVVIHHDRAFLEHLLGEIVEEGARWGLHVNHRKTRITPLAQGVTFLKTRYVVKPTGGVVRHMPREAVVRQRRKLVHLAELVVRGERPLEALTHLHASWRGQRRWYSAHNALRRVDALVDELLTRVELHRRGLLTFHR